MYGESRMYELDYMHERLDWNEYFTRYKETGDIKYYREFLHFYEPVLDRKTKRFIERYELDDYRAEDLKQIFSFLLWEELQNYDSDIPLLQMIKYKVQTAWQEYVRVNCGNFKIDNRHQYLLLKRIAYLYYQKKDNNSLSEIIVEIAVELNLTEESVENYLVAVSTFKPKYNADFYQAMMKIITIPLLWTLLRMIWIRKRYILSCCDRKSSIMRLPIFASRIGC